MQKEKICPQCSSPLALRKGPYGEFWGCPNYKECGFKGMKNQDGQGNFGFKRALADDQYDDIMEALRMIYKEITKIK